MSEVIRLKYLDGTEVDVKKETIKHASNAYIDEFFTAESATTKTNFMFLHPENTTSFAAVTPKTWSLLCKITGKGEPV